MICTHSCNFLTVVIYADELKLSECKTFSSAPDMIKNAQFRLNGVIHERRIMQTGGPLTEIREGDVTILVFGPELSQIDETNVADLGGRLNAVAEGLPNPQLILDMSTVEFFGSSFIDALFRVWKKMTARPHAQLAIAGLQPYCRDVLKITRLDSLWQIFDSRDSALENFGNAPASG